MNEIVRVKCKRNYLDLEFNRIVEFGEEWNCTRRRAETLIDVGVVDIMGE